MILQRRHRIAAILLTLIAWVGASLDSWGNVAAIVAAVAATLLLLAGFVGWLRRRWLFRKPIRVTYLVPQARYTLSTFPGGPETEQWPKELSVGERGEYHVMHRLVASQSLWLDSVRLEMRGPAQNMPQNLGITKPMMRDRRINERGDPELLNWHGIWHVDRPLPRMLPKDEVWITGHRLRTSGPWEGSTRLLIILRAEISQESKTEVIDLPFRVGSLDDVSFLRKQV